MYIYANFTCVVVSVIIVACSLSVSYLCFCFCFVLVNCLLNAFSICVGEGTVFSLKVIVVFLWLSRLLSSNVCLSAPSICWMCVFV